MLPAGMCVTTCLHDLSAKQKDQEASNNHDQSFSVSMRANGFEVHIVRVPVSVPIGANLGSDDCIVRHVLFICLLD